jgi:tetratricopeptide (TPR) repeat protein
VILALWLVGCGAAPEATDAPRRVEIDPCTLLRAPAPGPMAEARAQTSAPLALAQLFVKEARLTGDAGFYTLADSAIDCALVGAPEDREARRLRAHVHIQFHRFAEVEAEARKLTAERASWIDWALLGDALMEQGKLDDAADAYQSAMDLRPGLEMYDRVAWLRWLWGDVAGAVALQREAVAAGNPRDPEPLAWALTRLGWLNALQDRPSPEFDAALALVPAYGPAHFHRGRVRLAAGDAAGAAADLRAAGATVEAVWALSEIDPTASVEAVRSQDPRGYAIWLTPREPAAALALLEEEYKVRQDATTRMARAWAASRAGDTRIDTQAEAKAALATGSVEPRVLRMGSQLLGEPALLERALAMGPGLLPSERVP